MYIGVQSWHSVLERSKKDKVARETNTDIAKAITGMEVLNIANSDSIQFYYPVVAKEACLKCHTNAKMGDVLGVIDVSYPIDDLESITQ